MVKAKIRIWGYRCFNSDFPIEIEISNGFTAFIGPNNSGKSSLLKFFFDFRDAFSDVYHNIVSRNKSALNRRLIGINFQSPVTDPFEVVFNSIGPLKFEIEWPSSSSALSINKLCWLFNPKARNLDFYALLSNSEQTTALQAVLLSDITSSDHAFLRNGNQVLITGIEEVLYALMNIQYVGPFRNAINEGAGSYYDLGIGSNFVSQWGYWKTGGNKSENNAIQKVTEDIRRLLGVEKLEINTSEQLKTLQIVINNQSHKLSELGSGLAQLIIVLGNALIKKPTFILIDEPETHLHPSLQLDFLTSLASYAQFGVLYATHSLGLARSASDQCYSVIPHPLGSKVHTFHKTPRFAEFLGSMGIAGLQEIGCSHVLCVEGTTDVRTFQQILRKFKLERKVVIIPLGGSSMIKADTANELAELLRLGTKVSAVIDSEKKSADAKISKGRQSFLENCLKLKINCHILERRATENYFTEEAIKSLYKNKYKALGAFEVPSTDENAFWGKSENWRIAQVMTKSDFESNDLGKFIQTIK